MTTQQLLTPHQSQYFAWLLTRRAAGDSVESLASTLVDSQVDLNPQLAEALAKLEGFTYATSETHWWQHGHSSERDFIYVTTQNLSAEQLQALSDEVGPSLSLLVCCAAFHGLGANGTPDLFGVTGEEA